MCIDPQIRQDFPELQRVVHLNSAAMSLMSRRAREAVSRALTDREYTSEQRTEIRLARAFEARRQIADMIHASVEDLCIVTNTSEGLNIVAQGLDYKVGDKVVLVGTEFYGNIIPWLNLAGKGVHVARVDSRYGQDPTERILAAVDDRTRVLTISFVNWVDGIRVDVAKIGEFCRNKDIVFVVDGIQGTGVMEIDVSSSHVSFLSCGAQKWLMSPNGTGFIYVDKALQSRLRQNHVGYLSVIEAPDYFDSFRIVPRKNAERFRIGSISDIGIAAMGESLKLIRISTVPCIQKHVIGLNQYAAEKVAEMGFAPVHTLSPENMSGILTFHGKNMVEIYRRLIRNGIVVSLRNGWIRISPHLYNTRDDIDRMLEVLKKPA